jgi:hypothetical protein
MMPRSRSLPQRTDRRRAERTLHNWERGDGGAARSGHIGRIARARPTLFSLFGMGPMVKIVTNCSKIDGFERQQGDDAGGARRR